MVLNKEQSNMIYARAKTALKHTVFPWGEWSSAWKEKKIGLITNIRLANIAAISTQFSKDRETQDCKEPAIQNVGMHLKRYFPVFPWNPIVP